MAEFPSYYRESYFTSSTSLTDSSRDSDTATSLYTTTSASFAPGPGELTGRGLNAFGKMALSGVERIIVRRRLQVIGSSIPHADNAGIKGLENMYRHLLELSRFGLYSTSVRTRALHMILRQVADQHTAQLTQSLLEWPSDEAVLFISELLMCMDPTWTGLRYSRMPIHDEVQNIYSSFLTDLPDGHEATPFVKFIAQVASAGPTAAQIIVDAKILDVILFLYISAFVPHAPAYKSSSLFLACNDVLRHLATHPEGFQNLCAHPLHSLWPRRALMPLTEAVRRQVKDRQIVWRSLGLANPSMVTRRIMRIEQILELTDDLPSSRRDFPSNEMMNTTSDIFDDFVDIIEFLRSDIYGVEVARQARDVLALNIGSLPTIDDLALSYDDMLDYIESQILHEKLKCFDSFEGYMHLLDLRFGKEYTPLTEHVVEIVRKITESKKVSRSAYLAAVLAVPLHISKGMDTQDILPSKDRGPHLLFDPSITSPSIASPFCYSSVSYPASWLSPIQQRKSKHPTISTPYIARHVTHVAVDSSTGEYTNLPKGWLQVLKQGDISTLDRSSPKADSEIVTRNQERDGETCKVSDPYYGANLATNVIQQELSQLPSSLEIIKCVVVGDGGIDKTGLLWSYTKGEYPTEYSPTIFLNHGLTVMIGDEPYTLGLFDTSGQEDYPRLRPLTYRQTDVFLICFSVMSPSSFESVKEKWFPEVHHHCPGVPCLIVGIDIHLRDDSLFIERLARQRMKPITPEEGEFLARDLGAVKYLECSAVTQKGLKNVFDEAIVATLEPSPGKLRTFSWPKLRRGKASTGR